MIGKRLKPNRAKIAVLVLATLVATQIMPLMAVQVGAKTTSDTDKAPYFPGLPDNVIQYNKTDVTPVAQMEQVRAKEPALFQYRNMTMLMNCTQNCDLVITANPKVTPKIFGFSIDPNQTVKLTMNLSNSPLKGAQVNERTLNFYFGIEPNATLQLKAQLRLYINQTELSQELSREVNASRLTWMYWNHTRAEWEAVESHMDQNGYLVCNTDHFSTWIVAEMEPEEALQFALNMVYVYMAIIVVVAVILAIGVVALRKRN
jgi:hypothetical protein